MERGKWNTTNFFIEHDYTLLPLSRGSMKSDVRSRQVFLLNWALLWVVCLIKVPSTTILVKEKEKKKAWPQLLSKFYAILNFSKGSLINLFVKKLWIKNYTVHVSLKGSQKGVESWSFLCSKAKYSTTGKTKGRKQKLRGKRKVLW